MNILWITHLTFKVEFSLHFYSLPLIKFRNIFWHRFLKCVESTLKKKKDKKRKMNRTRRRWNRTTEHVSSPTDLKSALHTNEDHPRSFFFFVNKWLDFFEYWCNLEMILYTWYQYLLHQLTKMCLSHKDVWIHWILCCIDRNMCRMRLRVRLLVLYKL